MNPFCEDRETTVYKTCVLSQDARIPKTYSTQTKINKYTLNTSKFVNVNIRLRQLDQGTTQRHSLSNPSSFFRFTSPFHRRRQRHTDLHLSVEDGVTTPPTAATKPGLGTVNARPQHDQPRDKTASVSSPLSEAEVAARFQTRLRTLQEACRKYSNSSDFRANNRRSITINAFPPVWNHKLSYCPIQKISSTTWKGILKRMSDKIRKDYDQTKSGQGAKASQPSLEEPDEVRFTFVREPYGRLLSAYVDKIFSPDLLFWRKTDATLWNTSAPTPPTSV